MNVFFVIDNTLITPAAGKTILEGISRDSILAIAREIGIKSEVRRIGIDEVMDAFSNNRLQEAFGSGTAATIAHFETICFNGKDYALPALTDTCISNVIATALEKIWYDVEDKY